MDGQSGHPKSNQNPALMSSNSEIIFSRNAGAAGACQSVFFE
jgi:hypothetical protein